MKKDKDILTKEQAKEMLSIDKGKIHTFLNAPWGLVGADHSIKSIHKDIDNAFLLKKTGGQAQSMGYGLVICPEKDSMQSDLIFVETIKQKRTKPSQ